MGPKTDGRIQENRQHWGDIRPKTLPFDSNADDFLEESSQEHASPNDKELTQEETLSEDQLEDFSEVYFPIQGRL